MAHLTVRSGYEKLVDRLNRAPQGAPPSHLLYGILELLFSEREAGLVALLPIKPFRVKQAASVWKMPEAEARKVLEELASRAILLDIESSKGELLYVLPPPMAGFFEFSLMRVRGDVNQKVLSELFYEYITVEEEFIKALFTDGQTQLGRAFVQEAALPADNTLQVLDYERASEVIKSAFRRGIGMCYCRHKAQHLDHACDAPMDICMTFNSTAASLIRHGFAREIDAAEGLDLLQRAQDENLVQFGENVQRRVSFICNCCGCCCEAMRVQRRFAVLSPIHTSNYLPQVDLDRCNGCAKCVQVCPVEAMSAVSANDPRHPKLRKAKLDDAVCLGCGVCVRNCKREAIRLEPRDQRVITPVNSAHRTVLMALERGKLQELIFDNQALASHRAMAAILGVILKLPAVKQTLARRQMRSRYLDRLLGIRH
ncbi:MAG: 4Fe-4S dicluster domain-containing protein [Acidobacteriota bacterium]|nr:MAG: 4Fe-4S dicluster domain-containing protein [Acidobacteriota bacterium]